MGIVERYCRATQSSNLMDDAQHHSTEALAAVALSDLGINGIGNLLFRVKYANDATSYHRLAAKWEAIVIGKAANRKWPSHVPPKKVAQLALAHFLNDVCRGCSGKGHLPINGAPVLSDEPCPVCDGRGTVDVDCERRLEDYVRDMVESLNEMVRHAGALALRKLAGAMEV
ncbi:MAG TPA: hypothetical protein VF798_15460 [Burkholderiaceae bacterium]